MRAVKARLSTLGRQYASVSGRLGRVDDRLDRIETRLELADARD
jgi:hypothetical protein